jgi:hypothetical protein
MALLLLAPLLMQTPTKRQRRPKEMRLGPKLPQRPQPPQSLPKTYFRERTALIFQDIK